jgi:hypothetical protein
MPDEVLIKIFTQCNFRDQSLILLLNVLEESEFNPMCWARDERPTSRKNYSRRDLIFTVQGLGDLNTPHLYSDSSPGYTAYFTIDRQNLNQLTIIFNSSLSYENLIKILQLGSTLADAFKAEYGYVHLLWKDASDQYMQKSAVTRRYLQKYGPSPLLARTWLGSHLISLVGRERLESCGAFIQSLSYGGIQADLVDNLVDTDHRTLTIRQREVMEHLLPSGAFGDYSHPPSRKPGLNWHPIPIEPPAD